MKNIEDEINKEIERVKRKIRKKACLLFAELCFLEGGIVLAVIKDFNEFYKLSLKDVLITLFVVIFTSFWVSLIFVKEEEKTKEKEVKQGILSQILSKEFEKGERKVRLKGEFQPLGEFYASSVEDNVLIRSKYKDEIDIYEVIDIESFFDKYIFV